MTTGATPMIVSKKSQDAIVEFQKQCYMLQNNTWNLRDHMRKIDLAYIREEDKTTENTRAKAANRYGDSSRLQNVTIPVVMPQVEAAVTYQSSVFLQGTPIFGVVASPRFIDEAKQMEAVMAENSVTGGWVREFMLMFRDGFKYNLAAIEVSWERKVTAALESDVNFANGKVGKPKEVIWEGNKIKRLNLYNTFWDTRVDPAYVHTDGEFAGYTELMSRIKLKAFIAAMPDKMVANLKVAFESAMGAITAGTGGVGGIQSFFVPDINGASLLNRGIGNNMNWLSWAGMSGTDQKIQYKNMYEVTTLYARILPVDFDLRVPAASTPQIWKFIIVNHEVIIYCERMTNAHNMIPIIFSQPLEDGLGYQTKSLATNVQPFQDISSGLMNSVIAARRRAISDRGLYDPSRIASEHVNSTNPSAKIPVRPAAYGKPLNEAYFPIPFRDDQSQFSMQQIGFLGTMANQVSGQNPAKQGQFVKGNKTTHEFDTVMGNANGRDQMCAMLLEAQLFTPVKYMLKMNILQYQAGTTIFNPQTEEEVNIDPVKLRKAVLEFKVTDGLTPADKEISSDALAVSMQQIGSSPQIAAGYNLAPLFSYLMKTQGADLSPFEKSPEQIAYEQAVGQWQQVVMQLAKDNKEITPDQYPPQPLPEKYGYNPTGNNPSQSSKQPA